MKGVPLQQSLYRERITRQFERSSVVLLAGTGGGDGRFLLIEEGEHQAGIRHRIRDLIVRTRCRPAVGRAFHRLVELPSGDGRAGQREGLADLQRLMVRGDTGNRVAVHVDEVHRHGGSLIAGIVEVINVVLFGGGEHQGLLRCIGEEGLAVQFGMRGVKRIVIHRFRRLDDGGRIAGDILDLLFSSHLRTGTGLALSDDIPHDVAGLFTLLRVYKDNNV